MQFRKLLAFSLTMLVLALSACAPAKSDGGVMDQTEAPEAMMEKPTEDVIMENQASPDAMLDQTATPDTMMHGTPAADGMMMQDTATPDAMMEAPAWFGASLTDVSTGKTFVINDFEGKVVLLETMAVWCPTCKRQQGEMKAFHEALGMPEDLISISLDIDPNEDSADLKAYVEANNFDWIFAVSPADVSREIGDLYGAQFLNPPSTPILIIDRKGDVHLLPFGIKSADDLYNSVKPFLDESM